MLFQSLSNLNMKSQIQLFLTKKDEENISKLIQSKFDIIHFLDDNVWAKSPVSRKGIECCSSMRCYLYNRDISTLPTYTRNDGSVEGPVSGCVLQILRSKLDKENILYSGRLAVGFQNDPLMKVFYNQVYDIVKKNTYLGVQRMDGAFDKNYRVGYDAADKVKSSILKLADSGTKIPFLLSDY